MRKLAGIALAAVGLACASSDSGGFAQEGSGGFRPGGCYSDRDCSQGLVCRNLQCVADDGKPPEQEVSGTFLSPRPSPGFLWAPAPEADLVAVIDPATLRVRAVPLPPEPVQVEVIPGSDAAAILSRSGRALSRVEWADGDFTFSSTRTRRRYPAFALSPSGRWAVLYTPDGRIPDGGAEGIVAVVDVAAIPSGTQPVELAAGRRHTNVFFREAAGQAIVVGQQEIAVIDLAGAPSVPAARVPLPEGYGDAAVREAVVTHGGDVLLLRSLASSSVAVLDMAAMSMRTVSLPGPAYDLDATAGGAAVVALRNGGQVAWFDPQAAVDDPSAIHYLDVRLPGPGCTQGPCVAPGQVELAPDGAHAAVFTSASDAEAFGWLELASGELEVFADLEKPVRAVGIGPGGTRAIVLHAAEPGSTASDPYEREVDRQHGYSVVDLERRAVQLKLTGDREPTRFVFTPSSEHAAVALRGTRSHGVDAVNLTTLVTRTVPLASAPDDAGALDGEAAWVIQAHAAGRISFVDLATTAVRTITGFELNARIE